MDGETLVKTELIFLMVAASARKYKVCFWPISYVAEPVQN